ncbi:MAG TPA: response regulator transcription factor [Pseudonocardiaceae bacterium]
MHRVLRVVLIDSHPLFRFGLCAVLRTTPGCEVVGEAANGTAGIALARSLRPDVVVVDLDLPDIHGIDVTHEITLAQPGVGVLVLTTSNADETVFAAVRAGARGYLLKGAAGDEMLRAVHAVGNGEVIFGPMVASRVLDYFRHRLRTPAPSIPALTAREREVLDLIARGATNVLIAHKLGISHKTVRNHVSNIFGKLHVADRAQAIVRARQAGLGNERVDH